MFSGRSIMEANQGDSTDDSSDDEQQKNKQKIVRAPDQNPRPLVFLKNAPGSVALARFRQTELNMPVRNDNLSSLMAGSDPQLPSNSTNHDPNMDVLTLREHLDGFIPNLHPGLHDSSLRREHILPTEDALMSSSEKLSTLSPSLYKMYIADKNIASTSCWDPSRCQYRIMNSSEALKKLTPYMLVDRKGKNRIIGFFDSIPVAVDRTEFATINGIQIFEVKPKRSEPNKLEGVLMGDVIPISSAEATYTDVFPQLNSIFGSAENYRSINEPNLREINTSFHAETMLGNLGDFSFGPKSIMNASSVAAKIMENFSGKKTGEKNAKKFAAALSNKGVNDEKGREARGYLLQQKREELEARKELKRKKEENEDPQSLGGKKCQTKKCKTKKCQTKKCKTKRCKTKKCQTKKCKTKKCRTKKCRTKNCRTKKNKIS